MSLKQSTTAIVARNEAWTSTFAVTEPYEVGWAEEVIVFIRALKSPVGLRGDARFQISADGIFWVDEGTIFPLPGDIDGVTYARLRHFGNWIRISANLPEGSEQRVLVTLHCKG